MEKVRIGYPLPRILVNANIVRCKHPNVKYSDFEHYKAGHIFTYGEESWNKQYGDYDNLPEIKSGDIILNGREDKNGGNVAVRLVDINAKWNGSKCLIYQHTNIFYRVDLLEKNDVEVQEDVESCHRL